MDVQVRALFQQALELPPDQRVAWIERTCADQPQVAAELRELLTADAKIAGILDQPLESIAADLRLASDDGSIDRVGSRVGPYRLTAVLGSGGMGVVYRAEREAGGFVQTVALKLVRDEKLSGYARARFLLERSILARMQHPNIARLVDGGIGEKDEPWFAMEFIEGEPLLSWCDNRRLTIAERLQLMLDICSAVEYAHSHLVIHRDIKPGNIMVSSGHVVKLLDFGIAKMLEESALPKFATDAQTRLLTLEYAAPEQIRGGEITTATDVHALGLLLYELLCSLRAFELRDTTAFEAQRGVIENELATMAARLRQAGTHPEKSLAEIARQRHLHSAKLLKILRGDLQQIVAKATRKEPEQRYASVAAFADDIRRHLANKPVAAASGARIYYLRKFVQRNRVAVALSALAALSILVGLAAILWQVARVNEEARTALAARDFLVDVFKSASPYRTQGRVPSAIDLIDSGVQRAELELQDQPKLQAYLFEALGSSYATLGHRKQAMAILRRGLDAAIAVGDSDSSRTQEISVDLAELINSEEPASNEPMRLLDRVIVAQKQLDVDQRLLLVRALIAKGFNQLVANDYSRALATMREAIAESETQVPQKEYEHALAVEGLATVLAGMRHDLEAVAAYREVLGISERLYGTHSLPAARTQSIMSLPLIRIGAGKEAEQLLRYANESALEFLGENSPDYANILQRLGSALIHNNKLAEAQEVLDKALAIARAQGGETYGLADVLNCLSQLKSAQGQYASAEDYANQALSIYAKFEDATGVFAGMALNTRGVSLYGQGKSIEAERVFRSVSQLQQRNGWQFTVATLDYLGRARRALGHPDEALSLHKQAMEAGFVQSGDLGTDALLAKIELARDERDLGQLDQARRHLESALPALTRTFSAGDPTIVSAQYLLAQLDTVDERCTQQSLETFAAVKDQYRIHATEAGWQAHEHDLLIAMCRAQLHLSDPNEAAVQITNNAKALLSDARAEPYFKRLAADKIGIH
jgi:serine/threonine-protein kinase